MAANAAEVVCANDVAAPPPEDERSGLARVDSRTFGEEAARALDAQLRAQADSLRQERLPISAAELDDWVAQAKEKGVCGLVLAQDQALVMGPGGSTVPTAQRFRAALDAGADASFSLLQLPETRVRVLTELVDTSFDDELPKLPEIRVAVLHRDRGVRALWQRQLAFDGAEVLFDEVEDAALAALGESAPDLLVVHEDALCDLTRAGGWDDVRLQFSALLVVSASCAREIHPEDLVTAAADLLATQASLQARIVEAEVLAAPLESLGPARWLRELQGYEGLVELRVRTSDGTARVRMESGELHEASYVRDGEELQGTAALAALQDTRFGSLIVGPAAQVAAADWNHGVHAVPNPATPPPSSVVRAPSSAADIVQASASSNPPVAQGGAAWRLRAIAVTALALVATFGAGLRGTAPASGPRPAAVSGAAQPASRARAPRVEAAAVAPANEMPVASVMLAPAETATSSSVPQAPAEEALSVAAPAAEPAAVAVTQVPAETPGDVLPVVDVTRTADEAIAGVAVADEAPPAPPPQRAPATAASAPRSAQVGVANAASTGALALPARLRRWLAPTPAQKRVIDAFWARADKNFVRAERLLTEAHTLDPKEPEAAYQLGLTYARMGRLELALRWARQARELSSLDPAPIALEGDVLLLRGQRAEAEGAWKQCLQARPGDPGCVRRLEQLNSGAAR